MYKYSELKPEILKEENEDILFKVKLKIASLDTKFIMEEAIDKIGGSNWMAMACVDYLVELGEIHEINKADNTMAQYRTFIKI